MKLLVDSGSTKARWVFLAEGSEVRSALTPGINPMHQSMAEIEDIVRTVDFSGVSTVRFYGAGCAEMATNAPLRCLLARYSGTEDVTVESDIVGAAIGTLGSRPGIACILGTGANSVLWDGCRVTAGVNAGGYILGDEGSGAVMGRVLISDFVKGLTPEWLTETLRRDYGLDYFRVISMVYREPLPNRNLARFARLLGDHRDDPYVHDLITDQFRLFFRRNVCQYAGWQHLDVAFVGSIAACFETELRSVGAELGVHFGPIRRTPF